jgi:hypothetical protein
VFPTRIWLTTVVAALGLGAASPGVPTGAVVLLALAGPLAVGPDGSLFVYDQARHEVDVRTANGTFRVVAGNGNRGFSGDGGPATAAELSNVTDLAFGPGGLYLADDSRVRVVDAAGTIDTVARVPQPRSGSWLALSFSPSGELYLATSRQLMRLTPAGRLVTVRAVLRKGPVRGELTSFGQIAFGRKGAIYASSGERGWSLYEITPRGIAVYRGYARRSGGALASLAVSPAGVVEPANGSDLLAVGRGRLTTTYRFDRVPGTNWFTLTYFAIAPDRAIYADDIGTSGFQLYQQLIEVSHGHVEQLWRHRVRN